MIMAINLRGHVLIYYARIFLYYDGIAKVNFIAITLIYELIIVINFCVANFCE